MPGPKKPNALVSATKALRLLAKFEQFGAALTKRQRIERAEDLVDKALRASSAKRQLQLLNEALKLDPDNVEALTISLDLSGLEGQQRIDALRDIVKVAAKCLGKKAFRELVPHFWGFHETRPYMRAREQLAGELKAAGQIDEAIQEYSEMLVLNENDNQGIRYELLPCLLMKSRLEEARALMTKYIGDCKWAVVFTYGAVFERLLSGDDAKARELLSVAREKNPYLEDFALGRLKVPKRFPASYTMGSKEEALCYLEPLAMVWEAYPSVLAWLKVQPGEGKIK